MYNINNYCYYYYSIHSHTSMRWSSVFTSEPFLYGNPKVTNPIIWDGGECNTKFQSKPNKQGNQYRCTSYPNSNPLTLNIALKIIPILPAPCKEIRGNPAQRASNAVVCPFYEFSSINRALVYHSLLSTE